MANKIITISFILMSFALCVACMSMINFIVGPHVTFDEQLAINALIIGFCFFSDAGASLLGMIRAEARRKKIQQELDAERAFRKLGG